MNEPMGYTILDGEKWYREDQYDVLLERLDRQRETIIELQSKLEFSQRLNDQLFDKNTCMCGSMVDSHGWDDGHSPVSMYDYALDNALKEIKELKADRDRIIAMDNKMLKERRERIEELEDRPAHCPTCDGDHL